MDTSVLSRTDTTPQISRQVHIAPHVVFVNGLAGCGKTMLTPIVGSLPRVELMRYNYALETACIMHSLGKVSEDAAVGMVKLMTDVDIYHSMMSRETNFRFSDLSSVWRNSKPWRYLMRLIQEGDAAVLPRVEKQRPILNLVTHHLLSVSKPILKALGDRVTFIEVVRHPSYMVKQWYLWMPREGTDPRIFDVWFEHKGQSLPWMARGWEELFLKSNRMDRTIYGIDAQWRAGMTTLQELSAAHRQRVVVIPFEQFVLDPEPYLKNIESSLGTHRDQSTIRMLKKQNIPRKRYADGINLKIYKQYGWETSMPGATEQDELAKRRAFVAAEATPEALRVWDKLCAEYESTYLPSSSN